MKVIRVIPLLDFGGIEQVLMTFAIYNTSFTEPLDLKIIVLGKGGSVSDCLQRHKIDVQILGQDVAIPNLKLFFLLYRIFCAEKPDVVHCQTAEANFHGLIAAKLAGIPVRIGEEVGLPNHHSYWKGIFKLVYRCATDVIAISEAVKNTIVGYGEAPAHKVKIVYNPIGSDSLDNVLAKFSSEAETSVAKDFSKMVFITTCRLVPIKNLDRLIEAFAYMLKAGSNVAAGLWIVGDGQERSKLEDLSGKLGLQDHITFWGYQENVGEFLVEADVFVLPSLSEGSSVSLAEAMYMGLPSIVTNCGGAAEILGNSKSGLLVDPLDSRSIARAMCELLGLSVEERKEMGVRARREAERFKVENYLSDVLKLYSREG